MKLPGYKYIYADTNVISNICKEGGILMDFIRHFPAGEKNLLCFSTYTLYEISKSQILMPEFRKLYAIFPCAIAVSYFPLGHKEVEVLMGDEPHVDPLLLSPQTIVVDDRKIHPNSLDILLQTPIVLEAFKNVEQKTEALFHEYTSLLDKDEFVQFGEGKINRNQFVETFKRYELKYRFFAGATVDVDRQKLATMKTLEILAQGLYYKFYSDRNRKVSKSDVIDILIMTTAPYCDTFISENNCIDIYRKIINSNECDISTNYMTISDLKK